MKIGLLILFYSLTTISAFANGRMSGVVKEKGSGELLAGANVYLVGTSYGAAADVNGFYLIRAIKPGNYTVRITYLGFQDLEQEIVIKENEDLKLNFELEFAGIEGEEVLVTAQARGQIDAINQQRMSNTISNVVAKDRIQELPDVNAAESIGRLPGVSIQRSGGEANKVAIRGLSPRYNTVTVNGVRVPSTDTDDRSVDLSLISSNMLDGIEVSKALTPDKDADAIGGSIDLKLREADAGWKADFQAQGAYTALQDYYGNYKAVGSISNRFLNNKLGIIVGFNTDRYDRSADKMSVGYNVRANPEAGNDTMPGVWTMNMIEDNVIRGRLGGSTVIDYKIPFGQIMINGFYNKLINETLNRSNYLQVNPARHSYSMGISESDASISTLTFGVNKDFNWINYDIGFAMTKAENNNPRNLNWNFQEESAFAAQTFDFFALPENIPGQYRDSLDNTFFESLGVTSIKSSETEKTYQANITIPYQFGSWLKGSLKFGGKIREKDRFLDQEGTGRGLFYGGDAAARDLIANSFPDLGLTVNMNRLPLTAFQDTYSRSNFLNSNYPLGYTLRLNDLRAVTKLLEENELMFLTGQQSLIRDYEGFERISAAYAMVDIKIGKYITVLPGFRYEKEHTDYSANYTLGAENRINEYPAFIDTNSVRNNSFILPMVHVRVKPAEWFDIRLAYTESLTRPNYSQFAPITYVSQFKDWINAGNPNLTSAHAYNYDASISVYQNYVGFLTVSAFYKEIDDLIWNTDFFLVEGQNILPDFVRPEGVRGVPRVNTPINNPYRAYFKGLEFDWQTNFWYLPSLLKGLVFNANVTVIDSKTKFPVFTTEKILIRIRPPLFKDTLIAGVREGKMPDQPELITNLTLGYDYKGFSSRLSFIYQKRSSQGGLSGNPLNDRFTSDYYRYDLSVKQKVNASLQVYLNISNLNNRADRSYQYQSQYPTFVEYYGTVFDLGLRYTFK